MSDNCGVQNHILIAFTEVFVLTAGFGSQVKMLALQVYNDKVSKCTNCGEHDTHITCLSTLTVTNSIQENPHI